MTIGGDFNQHGSRFTSVSLNSKSRRLSICTTLGTNNNRCYNSPNNLPMNKFTNVQIRQTWDTKKNIFRYIISIDRVLKHTINNPRPVAIRNVKLWASDPWNDAADATIRNLVFENLPYGMIFIIIYPI